MHLIYTIVNKIASRRSLAKAGIIWAVIAAGIAGLYSGNFERAVMIFGPNGMDDKHYHFHISSIFTAVVTLLFIILISRNIIRYARSTPLRNTFGSLIIMDFVAVILGAGLVYCMGWGKECFDALQGTYAAGNDMSANQIGILQYALLSLSLLLPLHMFLMVYGDRLRHWARHQHTFDIMHLERDGFAANAYILKNGEWCNLGVLGSMAQRKFRFEEHQEGGSLKIKIVLHDGTVLYSTDTMRCRVERNQKAYSWNMCFRTSTDKTSFRDIVLRFRFVPQSWLCWIW
ncbi:MAG: hypothetical protein GY850_30610 [bacterium]|nr:hypothetical protein [bacterium]